MNKLKKIISFIVPKPIIKIGFRVLTKFYIKLYKIKSKKPIIVRKNTTDEAVFRQVFIKKEYDFKFPNKPKFIIDGGANVGYASIWFADRYPEADIFSIEPEESNYRTLKQNIKEYPHVKAIKAGLWNKKAYLKLIDRGTGKWGFMTKEVNFTDEYDIKAITIGDLLKKSGHKEIDILKLDVEGAEKAIFSDNYESWLNKVNVLMIELHDRIHENCSEVFYSTINKYKFRKFNRGENVILIKDK